MNNLHYLAVTALGSQNEAILEAFTKISKQTGCNILESKLTSFGEECALVFHFAGSWNTIAKLEAALPILAQQTNFIIHSKRTLPRQKQIAALPYQVQVTAQDRSGILNELALFFAQHHIRVEKMESETYLAKNQTCMTQILFEIGIPAKKHIATIREQFIVYCDEKNLDAAIDPSK